MDVLIAPSLWVAAIATGLMGGVYFAFSAFVMAALAALPEAQGMRAMQSINRVILRSAFMPLFFGSALIALILGVAALADWDAPGSPAMAAAAAIYVVGMFGCTVARNVPLNRSLDRVDPDGPDAPALWSRYRASWTRWNHLRTVASLAACALYVMALLARQG